MASSIHDLPQSKKAHCARGKATELTRPCGSLACLAYVRGLFISLCNLDGSGDVQALLAQQVGALQLNSNAAAASRLRDIQQLAAAAAAAAAYPAGAYGAYPPAGGGGFPGGAEHLAAAAAAAAGSSTYLPYGTPSSGLSVQRRGQQLRAAGEPC